MNPRIARPFDGRSGPDGLQERQHPRGQRLPQVAAREGRPLHQQDAQAELGEPGPEDAPRRPTTDDADVRRRRHRAPLHQQSTALSGARGPSRWADRRR